jgi:hypothetical protein
MRRLLKTCISAPPRLSAPAVALSTNEPPALCTSPRPKLDPKQETFLVALGVVETISDETMRKTFKNALEPWQRKQWCIVSVKADFVWRMEDVLDLYAEPMRLIGRWCALTSCHFSCWPTNGCPSQSRLTAPQGY